MRTPAEFVVFITGKGDQTRREQIQEFVATSFYTKPQDPVRMELLQCDNTGRLYYRIDDFRNWADRGSSSSVG